MAGKPYRPTPDDRKVVLALVSFGNTYEQIAAHLRISSDTLVAHYKTELETGAIDANAKVAAKLYKKATEDEDLGAIIFWLKTRARWRTEDSKMESESKKQIEADIRQLREKLDEKYKKEY